MNKTGLIKLIVFCGLGFLACKAEPKAKSSETEVVLSSPCDLLRAVENSGMEKTAQQSAGATIVYQGETGQIEECALTLFEKIESQAIENQTTYGYQLLEAMCINADGSISEALGTVVFNLFEEDKQDFMEYSLTDNSCLPSSLVSEMMIRLSGAEEDAREELISTWSESIKRFEASDGQKANYESLIKTIEEL